MRVEERKYFTCHSHLAHQVYILLLILLCDQDVGPIGFEVANFTDSKLLDLEYPDINHIDVPGLV